MGGVGVAEVPGHHAGRGALSAGARAVNGDDYRMFFQFRLSKSLLGFH